MDVGLIGITASVTVDVAVVGSESEIWMPGS
jgi:hypothetical protein